MKSTMPRVINLYHDAANGHYVDVASDTVACSYFFQLGEQDDMRKTVMNAIISVKERCYLVTPLPVSSVYDIRLGFSPKATRRKSIRCDNAKLQVIYFF